MCTATFANAQQAAKPSTPPPTPSTGQVVKLPEATTKQVKELQGQIEQVQREAQREIERLNLLKQNALLLGCIKVGVTSAQLEDGQLDVQGDALVIRPKTEEERKKAQSPGLPK